MSKRIKIQTGNVTVEGELNESRTAVAIYDALPVTSRVNTWVAELYFTIPVTLPAENGREVVSAGDIAYWPPGKALCLFFGPTPASRADEIRAASAVNVFGKITGDPQVFPGVRDGAEITVSRVA